MEKIKCESALLFENYGIFPSTRYQGSKYKLVDWIWENIKELEFKTALDAFGGTGSVAYLLKSKGKQVTYNDILKFNWYIGLALIENNSIKLSEEDVDFLITRHKEIQYPTFVYDTFKDIYYTDEENQWIDTVATNISFLENIYKKALAYYALFQSCIAKRPFNLFHRKNLYIRLSEVERSFGNKATWDTPFETHFKNFVLEANRAVFSNNLENKALNKDVFEIEGTFDLVYIDPPYISKKGTGVDYLEFYHFLEGLAKYSEWKELIDYNSKHRRFKKVKNCWNDENEIYNAFERLFKKFSDSILVVSYRSDGIPSIDELEELLKKYKKTINIFVRKNYKYVLSNGHTDEVLFIAN